MRYIRRLADVGRGDLAVAGGKGANLGELTRAGVPVPPGFVLTTAAYRTYVDRSGIGDEILAAVARDDAAARIRALFTAPIPEALGRRAPRRPRGARPRRRGPLVGHRGRPRGRELRRPAGHVPQRPGRRRAARCGPRLLGVAVDGARHRVPGPARDRPGGGRARGRRPGDGRRRRRRGPVHREPHHGRPRRGRDRRGVGARRGGRRRQGDHGRHRRREGRRPDPVAHHRGQGRADRRGRAGHGRPAGSGRGPRPSRARRRRGGRPGRARRADRGVVRRAAGRRVGPGGRRVRDRAVPADHGAARGRRPAADGLGGARPLVVLRAREHRRATAGPALAPVRRAGRRVGHPVAAGVVRRAAGPQRRHPGR